MTFLCQYDYGYAGFQYSVVSSIPQEVEIVMTSPLNLAMGFSNTEYTSATGNMSIYSEISVGSSNNSNAILVHLNNLPIKSYNGGKGTFNAICGTIPLSNSKSSSLNYTVPHLFYLELKNGDEMVMHNFDVFLSYPNGLPVDDLAPDSTIVLSIV